MGGGNHKGWALMYILLNHSSSSFFVNVQADAHQVLYKIELKLTWNHLWKLLTITIVKSKQSG